MKYHQISNNKQIAIRKNKAISGVKSSMAPFAVVAIFAVTFASATLLPVIANADSYDEQIKTLQNQNGTLQSDADVAKNNSDTRQGQIDQLQAQINQLQSQINESNNKINELNSQIQIAENQIKIQGAALADTLQDIYYSSQSNSTLNILMNSNSISDYVDAQSRQVSMQEQMQETIKDIASLKKQIESQKAQIQSRLSDQKAQQSQIASSQAEVEKLKAQDDAAYAASLSEINANNDAIKSLKAQQRAANEAAMNSSGSGQAVSGDPSKGGYPAYLDNAPQDSLVDPWGMYNRECVSYTAWKVHSTYGYMPYWGGRGNAKNWPRNAMAAGIPTSATTPKAKSVAILTSGTYGHAAWVESINSDGTINISEYNFATVGGYGERKRVAASHFDYYIYFGDR